MTPMTASDPHPFRGAHPSTAPSVSGIARAAPKQLGEYDLLDHIGAGGMGTVYRARHRRLRKIVAIKILPVDSQDKPDSLARFEREMIAVGRLEHPNIIRAHDAGEENGLHYLVLEFADGYDLSKLSRRMGPMPVADGCELIRQAAVGLQYAHEYELVHRDIKPSNLLLTRSGIVKILDLGLAQLSGESLPAASEGLTTTGQIMGTLDFLAPEQADDTHSVDIRADIYSLGCTFYSLLIGHAPFVGESYSTPVRKIGAHMNRPVPDMRELREDVPDGLVEILNRMTAKSAADRYEDPGEVAVALTQYSNGHNLVALVEATDAASEEKPDATKTQVLNKSSLHETTNGQLFSVDADLVVTPKASESQDEPRKWGKRLTWLIALGFIGFSALAAVVVTIRDKNGRVIAKIEVPEGGSYEAKDDGDSESKLALKEPPPRKQIEDRKMSVTEEDISGGSYDWPADAPAPAIAPFDDGQANAHQEVWAKHLKIPVEFENSIGMKFRLIPPSEFLMGSTTEEKAEAASNLRGRNKDLVALIGRETPRHTVILTKPYYIGVTEVTQSQYEQVMGNNPSSYSAGGEGEDEVLDLDTSNYPVESVNFSDATAFCTKLSQQDELNPANADSKAVKYRLPSVAEWENACRAGTTTPYWIGSSMPQAGWCSGNSKGRTQAVGELQPNPFGLFDVHGNVLEWTKDAEPAEGDEASLNDREVDPVHQVSRKVRVVMRGGSFINHPSFCRSSAHYPMFRQSRMRSLGFRVVLEIESP